MSVEPVNRGRLLEMFAKLLQAGSVEDELERWIRHADIIESADTSIELQPIVGIVSVEVAAHPRVTSGKACKHKCRIAIGCVVIPGRLVVEDW